MTTCPLFSRLTAIRVKKNLSTMTKAHASTAASTSALSASRPRVMRNQVLMSSYRHNSSSGCESEMSVDFTASANGGLGGVTTALLPPTFESATESSDFA